MVIDIKNLILFAGTIHLVEFLVFLLVYLSNKKLQGCRWWLMWSITEVLGFLLILLRLIPFLVPYMLIFQNIILVSGTIFMYFGIIRFFGKKINLKFIIPFFLTFLSLHLFFYFVIVDAVIRSVIFNTALSLAGFLSALILYKNKSKSISATAIFLTVVFIVHSLVYCWRTIMIISGTSIFEPVNPTLFNALPFIDSIIAGLFWTFGFIILLNQKLNSENAELKEEFELIFNTSPDAAIITRLSDGYFLDCNEGYTKIMGYTKAEMTDKTIPGINIWRNPDEGKEFQKQLMENGICENYEAVFQTKNSEIITGLVSAKIMMFRGVPHIFSIARDISEKKAAQEKEQKYLSELKELNSVKDKLFSILGHDLRSPFSAIIGLSDLLKENLNSFSKEEIEEMAGEIYKSGENTLKLLESILNWAKTQTGQIKINLVETPINVIILNAVTQTIAQANEKGITIDYHQPSSFTVTTDENIVSTVLRNLLSNATKFTNPGGLVNINTIDQGNFVMISVTDNGTGMTEETKNSLFKDIINPSLEGTNMEKGTGLGLAICKELVERLGGTIHVESIEGKGSTFSFTLPKNQEIFK